MGKEQDGASPRRKFREIFNERLDAIEAEANAHGLTMTDICRKSGISRATPDRWRKKPPKTVALLDEMEAILVRLKTKKDKEKQKEAAS